MVSQQCFEKDGYIFCNGIYIKGKLRLAKGKWYKFPARPKKQKTTSVKT